MGFRDWKNIYRAARDEISNGNYQFIYSVHGIGAAHLAALRLRKGIGLPWVAEFRDPWPGHSFVWDYMKDKCWQWYYKYNRRNAKRLLRKVLQYADLIVVESPMHRDVLVRDFGINKNSVVPYGIGYDEEYFSQGESSLIKFVKKHV